MVVVPPPVLGLHTLEVLSEFNVDRAQIDKWAKRGCYFEAPKAAKAKVEAARQTGCRRH